MSMRYACAAIFCALVAASPAWAQAPGPLNAITDVPGIKVGQFTGGVHASSLGGSTGTTVILTEAGATAGVTQRGGAPGTRETDSLKPEKAHERLRRLGRAARAPYC